ncbi:PilW family protein [Halopseudomonas pachastrellae]|nr:PilW family protein [Halopseudomonas pachastrellae]
MLALSVDDSEGNPVAFQSTDGGANGNDVLVVSYLAQRACQGADLTAGGANPEGEIVVNRYFVVDDSLWCASVRQLEGGVYAALAPNAVELISGVDSFQVLYGVDGSLNGEIGATRFVSATDLAAADSVVSIRVGLLLRSSDTTLPVPAGGQTVSVLDQQVVTPEDRAIRRVFSTTAQVRNVYWMVFDMSSLTNNGSAQRGSALIVALFILLMVSVLGDISDANKYLFRQSGHRCSGGHHEF